MGGVDSIARTLYYAFIYYYYFQIVSLFYLIHFQSEIIKEHTPEILKSEYSGFLGIDQLIISCLQYVVILTVHLVTVNSAVQLLMKNHVTWGMYPMYHCTAVIIDWQYHVNVVYEAQ